MGAVSLLAGEQQPSSGGIGFPERTEQHQAVDLWSTREPTDLESEKNSEDNSLCHVNVNPNPIASLLWGRT